MKIYTGTERIWSVPAWAPILEIPAITYRYSLDDLAGWVDIQTVKFSSGQSSTQMVKHHSVTRVSQTHYHKRYHAKGSDSVRRWFV